MKTIDYISTGIIATMILFITILSGMKYADWLYQHFWKLILTMVMVIIITIVTKPGKGRR